MSASLSAKLNALIETLPDPAAARSFAEHLSEMHPREASKWFGDELFMSKVLALAAFSPLLGQTLLQQPEHLHWLSRERDLQLSKPKERLREQVARFASRHSTLPEQIALSRFKRRELLRIYLRDCVSHSPLAEITDELSNLADVLLERTLRRCLQTLEKESGVPMTQDSRGRLVPAEFAIVALGKLGSRELNYCSDIDLLFLYSGDGETRRESTGKEPSITNVQFYTRLAERVTGVIGKVAGEGAVYRVDLRLRPRGRMGSLVVSLANAIVYYRDEAQNWERQTLIKARCAAGSEKLVASFLRTLGEIVYPLEDWPQVLVDVRQSKEKIDRQQLARGDEDNVKLGRGGIREIEFITQALQLYHGGRDPWVRSPNTLIGIERLTEHSYLNEQERTHLTDAYAYLRTLEHRLQMEHGVQTHSLPKDRDKLALVSRRMGYLASEDGLSRFAADLERHRSNVNSIFNGVFARAGHTEREKSERTERDRELIQQESVREVVPHSLGEASKLLSDLGEALSGKGNTSSDCASALLEALRGSKNPLRTLRALRRFVASLDSRESVLDKRRRLPLWRLQSLARLFARSGWLSEMLLSHPHLIYSLNEGQEMMKPPLTPRAFLGGMRERMPKGGNLAVKMAVMRTYWHEQILRIASFDLLGRGSLAEVNQAQTALATASIEIASDLALDELLAKHSFILQRPQPAILGLGRISHAGIDYGSDLDLLVVYDDESHDSVAPTTPQELYGEFVELFVRIMSSLTREGSLYRIDLRLRPDGSKGMLACSVRRFTEYVEREAQVWELLAYIKTRPVGGNLECGRKAAENIVAACFRASMGKETLTAHEIVSIRRRLQKEKAASRSMNIKWGPGAMFDVYFATRFLQLTRSIKDPEQAGTVPLLSHLKSLGMLTDHQFKTLERGYIFLRGIDHELRLCYPKRTYSLPSNQAQLAEIANHLGYEAGADLADRFREETQKIERVFWEILSVTPESG